MNKTLLQQQVQNRNTTTNFDDVWSEYEKRQQKQTYFNLPKIAIISCVIFLIAAPVSATIYINWYNAEFKIEKEEQAVHPTTKDIPWLEFETYPAYLNTLNTTDLSHAVELANFEIRRPYGFTMPLILSKGEINSDGKEIKAYWDLFHSGEKWIYARQSLHEKSKQLLNEAEMKTTFDLPANVKVVSIENADAIALLTNEAESGHRIQMLLKVNDEQVISFEIRGNFGEDGVIQLARSYAELSN